MPTMRTTALAAALITLFAGLASADTITLKNKGRFDGVITKETETHVTIRTEWGEVTFPKKTVAKVERKRWTKNIAAAKRAKKAQRWSPTRAIQSRRGKATTRKSTARKRAPARAQKRTSARKAKRKT